MKNANRTMRLYIFPSLFFDFFPRYKSKIVVLIDRNFSICIHRCIFFFFVLQVKLLSELVFNQCSHIFSMNIIKNINLENIIRIT